MQLMKILLHYMVLVFQQQLLLVECLTILFLQACLLLLLQVS